MRKFILGIVLVFMISSVAFAVSDKIGVGLGYALRQSDTYLPATELSVRGIWSNVAIELSGASDNYAQNKEHDFTSSNLALSASYLFDFKNNIALEAGVTAVSLSYSASNSAEHSSGLGLLLGAEYFVSDNFGIGIRMVPLLSVTGASTGGGKWTDTFTGYASVSGHLYL